MIPLSEAIVVAIIGGVFTLTGVVITVWASSRKAAREQRESNAKMIAELKQRSDASDAKLDKEVALLRAEVDELMREVRLHNGFAQRMPAVEADIQNIKDQINRIESERSA